LNGGWFLAFSTARTQSTFVRTFGNHRATCEFDRKAEPCLGTAVGARMRNRNGRQGQEAHMGLSCNETGLLDQVPSFVATISIA
jgi:hypothetical protein